MGLWPHVEKSTAVEAVTSKLSPSLKSSHSHRLLKMGNQTLSRLKMKWRIRYSNNRLKSWMHRKERWKRWSDSWRRLSNWSRSHKKLKLNLPNSNNPLCSNLLNSSSSSLVILKLRLTTNRVAKACLDNINLDKITANKMILAMMKLSNQSSRRIHRLLFNQ